MSSRVSQHDRDNLSRILGGYGDWFSAKLFRLIMKADFENKARLRLGFPEHVQVYEDYVNNSNTGEN